MPRLPSIKLNKGHLSVPLLMTIWDPNPAITPNLAEEGTVWSMVMGLEIKWQSAASDHNSRTCHIWCTDNTMHLIERVTTRKGIKKKQVWNASSFMGNA